MKTKISIDIGLLSQLGMKWYVSQNCTPGKVYVMVEGAWGSTKQEVVFSTIDLPEGATFNHYVSGDMKYCVIELFPGQNGIPEGED